MEHRASGAGWTREDLIRAARRLYGHRPQHSPKPLRQHHQNQIVEAVYERTATRARAKQWNCLTAREFRLMWQRSNGRCELTGIPFDLGRTRKDVRMNPHRPSLDRIDSKRGYEAWNCRLVLVCVNIALSDHGTKVFDKVCRAYVAHTRDSAVDWDLR